MMSVTRSIKNYCGLLSFFLVFCSQVSNESLIPETGACSSPPRLTYGELKESDMSRSAFPIGTKVAYNCRPGYMRVPGTKSHIICMENLQWSTPDLFCKPRPCGHPGDLMNGEFEALDFIFGSRVTYTCNTGYRMVSKRPYRDCQADGTWSNTVPECEAVICSVPNDVTDGSYEPQKEEYNYMDAVTYTCKYGVDLIGDASIHCTEDGIWSSDPPQCKVISCPNPIVPNSQKLSGFSGPYKLNSAVRFQCYSGFLMRGSALIKCGYNGKWEPDIPKCMGTCRPPAFDFAELEEKDKLLIDKNMFIQDTTLHYKCRVGYEQVPNTTNAITCLGNGILSPYEKFCTRISCGDPGEIENGDMMVEDDFLYNSTVYYICHKGFKMISNAALRCEKDGKWSGSPPVCEVIICPTPEISNGTYHPKKNTTYFYKDFLTFSCDDNLRLIGERFTECNESGQWSSPPPECKAVCASPPKIEHADLKQQNIGKEYFNIGTVLQYKCQPGYIHIPNTNSTITCTRNLTWSTPDIFCTPRSCGHPGEINNGHMEASDFSFGSKVYYTCSTGYKMKSNINYRECLADGNWTKAIPECKVQTCPVPSIVLNGSYRPKKEEYQYEDSITYECKNGLYLFGKSTLVCTKHGTWSSHAPQCKESACDAIWATQEEMRQCTSTPDEWIKYLQVKYLYLQIVNIQMDIEKKNIERRRYVG